jgi:hypothetical protein
MQWVTNERTVFSFSSILYRNDGERLFVGVLRGRRHQTSASTHHSIISGSGKEYGRQQEMIIVRTQRKTVIVDTQWVLNASSLKIQIHNEACREHFRTPECVNKSMIKVDYNQRFAKAETQICVLESIRILLAAFIKDVKFACRCIFSLRPESSCSLSGTYMKMEAIYPSETLIPCPDTDDHTLNTEGYRMLHHGCKGISLKCNALLRCRDSWVVRVTGYGLDDRSSVPRKAGIFYTVSRPALVPTQPPIHWVTGVDFPGEQSGQGVKLTTHLHCPICIHGIVLHCLNTAITYRISHSTVHSYLAIERKALYSYFSQLQFIYVSRFHPGIATRWGEWIFSIYIIFPAALGPGVYSAPNRNEYQKMKNYVSGE